MNRADPAVVAAFLLGVLCSCQSPGSPVSTSDPASGALELRDIFLGAPAFGEAPRLLAHTASGRFAVFSWRGLERDEQGLRRFASPPQRYLVDTQQPADPCPDWGLDLELCWPAAEAGGAAPAGFSEILAAPRGDLFLCVRERQVWILDPHTHTTRLLLELGAQPVPSAGSPSEPGEPAMASGSPALHSLASVRFVEDGLALEIDDGSELLRFELPFDFCESGWRSTPVLELTRAEWLSQAIAPPTSAVQWSGKRDCAACFSEPIVERAPEQPAPWPDVWHAGSQPVALEAIESGHGFGELSLAPDGRFVFGSEEDTSNRPPPQLLPAWLGERVVVSEQRRENADTPPYPKRLWIWDTSSGARSELFAGAEAAWWSVLGWAPQTRPGAPARLGLQRYSADWKRCETWVWSEGELLLALVEQHPQWVDSPYGQLRWSADGSQLLLVSECLQPSSTPGHAQLFRVDLTSGRIEQCTAVQGEVDRFELAGSRALVRYSELDPALRRLGWLDLDALEKGLVCPPQFDTPGSPLAQCMLDELSLATSGSSACFVREAPFEPGEWWWADPERAWQLSWSAPADFLTRHWIHPERLVVRALAGQPDQAEVHAQVFLPPGSRLAGGAAGHPRAAICFVHGAGYLQNVQHGMTEYPLNLLFHSRLASLGYVVVDVDYRGSAGYGAPFRSAVQYRLGELELVDYHAVLDELARRGLIDGARVALYGGSYGGFLTLMALFLEPGRWRAGAALRSVTDWRSYNPGYTQPRLGRPSTHPEAYVKSSPIDHVAGLADPLYLFHGLQDDNVFAQDTIRLIEQLIELGKNFEAMLYPSQPHTFRDGEHWLDEYTRIERFLLEHLGPP